MAEDSSEQIAQEIMDYLSAHPKACDTSAGIEYWWLQHQRILQGLDKVEEALERLESRNLVSRQVHGDHTVFHLNNNHEKGRE